MTGKTLSLQQIFCQDKAISSLQKAFGAGKMAHAYIFAGPDGVGRAATAAAWAKMLLCQKRIRKKISDVVFFDSCGKCSSCLLFDGGGHPDYISVYKELTYYTEEGKNRKTPPLEIPIAVVRKFLIERLAGKPQMGEFVVYVIHEAEKLNPEGQNALLKTLEEPPVFCLIILVCTRPQMLFPTIHSRCQLLRFGPVDKNRILAVLKEKGVLESAAAYWASFCEGSLGRALGWALLNCGDKSVYDIKTELVRRLGDFELADTIELAEWLSQSSKKISASLGELSDNISTSDLNRRAQNLLLQMILWVISDTMKLSVGFRQDLVNMDQIEIIEKLAKKVDSERAGDLIERIHQKMQWIDDNVNEKLIFEGLLLNLAGVDIITSTV